MAHFFARGSLDFTLSTHVKYEGIRTCPPRNNSHVPRPFSEIFLVRTLKMETVSERCLIPRRRGLSNLNETLFLDQKMAKKSIGGVRCNISARFGPFFSNSFVSLVIFFSHKHFFPNERVRDQLWSFMNENNFTSPP